MSRDWNVIVFQYVCPTLGVLISSALYAAPVQDLRKCLQLGSLGVMNPKPWAVMSGNCLGWLCYAYYARDPFILASNIPGILVSTWLNLGASKLQYYKAMKDCSSNNGSRAIGEEDVDAAIASSLHQSSSSERVTMSLTPQDTLWLQILSLWVVILVSVGWSGFIQTKATQKEMIGLLVNINLLFFYGAPLHTMKDVLNEKCSNSIHTPTVLLNCINAAFWAAYGFAVNDIVVYGPNGLGLLLGLIQALLCCVFPKRHTEALTDVDPRPLLQETGNEETRTDFNSTAAERRDATASNSTVD